MVVPGHGWLMFLCEIVYLFPHARVEAWKFYGADCASNNERSIYNNE